MDFLIKFFQTSFTDGAPKPYGWFHLMFCGIVLLASFLLIKFFRNCSDKTYRKITLICWLILVVFELYKEIYFLFFNNDYGVVKTFSEAHYQWYIFPFQFCSTPFYILPFIVFLKDGKIRDAFIAFASVFVFVAGVSVYILPTDVFIKEIGISTQTMVHHGIQIVFGVFTAIRYKDKWTMKKYLPSVAVFGGLVALAILLNEIYHLIYPNGETFNMFFISRHYPSTLPILSSIWGNVPYILFVLLYVVAFALAGFLIYLLWMGIGKLTSKNKQAK